MTDVGRVVEERSHGERPYPRVISTALACLCVDLAANVYGVIIYWFQWVPIVSTGELAVRFVPSGLEGFLIYMLWSGRSWPRIILLIQVGAGTVLTMLRWHVAAPEDVSGAIAMGRIPLGIVIVVLLFSRASSEWFGVQKRNRVKGS
jgi:hypothetical protein